MTTWHLISMCFAAWAYPAIVFAQPVVAPTPGRNDDIEKAEPIRFPIHLRWATA